MKKTTIQILSIILTMGMLSSCNNVDSKSDTAKSTEPVEMVTAEIPEKPEESESQEIERASFKGNDGVETVTDKELIYNVKDIIDNVLENGTVVEEIDVSIPNGLNVENSITYIDNGETVRIQLNMELYSNSEYNVDGNEVIKINAKYYVVPEDSYNELMSLYRQGRAMENDGEETEAEPQEIERASFKGGDGVETVTDKELIYNVKAIIDDLLTNGTIVDESDISTKNGGVPQSITYVDNGETIRIKWNMSLDTDSEYYVDGNEVIKINSKYYVVPVEPYIELMSLYDQGRATENENEDEGCRMEFINGDEVAEISDKEIVSRIWSISTILSSDLIETERYDIDIEQTENTVPQGIQFPYGDGVTKRIEWNFYAPSSDKYNDKIILRETLLFDNDYDDSVSYCVARPEQYDMLLELYNTAVSQ